MTCPYVLCCSCQPTEGEIRFNSKLKMGIYNQHFVDILPMDKTPVEHLRDQFQDQDYQSIRNRLGRYGLQVRASHKRKAQKMHYEPYL